MAEGISFVKQYTGETKTINYEVAVNLHCIETNKLIPTLIQKKIDPFELLAIYGSLKILSGYIRAGRPKTNYNEMIGKRFDDIRSMLDLKKIAAISDSEELKISAYFALLDLYEWQIEHLNAIGLTPPIEEDDELPNIKEVEDFKWIPAEGDFDYDQEDELSSTSEEPSTSRVDLEKDKKTG